MGDSSKAVFLSYASQDAAAARRICDALRKAGHEVWFDQSAYGQLGDRVAAVKAVQELLKVQPGFAGIVRKHIERWWDPEYVERLIDGWRKAGLEIPSANTTLS